MKPIRTLIRLCTITLCVFSVSGSVCLASVEPDLTIAVRAKNLSQVKNLLSEGADVNERDEGEEQTPLMRAVQVGDATIAQLLIAHGADVNARDDAGQTALMFAMKKRDATVIRVLLDGGAHLNNENREELQLLIGNVTRHKTKGHFSRTMA